MTIQPLEATPTPGPTCSLYVHDSASVRFIRVTPPGCGGILTVHGPGASIAVYTCSTEWECVEKERELEAALREAGYARQASHDRRTRSERRRFFRGDRRRPSAYR